MVTDMTSQVPLKYSPKVELQRDIVSQTLQQRKTLSSLLKGDDLSYRTYTVDSLALILLIGLSCLGNLLSQSVV